MVSKQGRGPLLIYISGLDGTGRLFYRQAPALEKDFTVITFPLRTDPPFGYQDLIDDVRRILDQEHCKQATILGESFGGTIALHFSLAYPERVQHLVLVNTFPYFRRRIRLWLGRKLLPLAFTGPVRWGRDRVLPLIFRREKIDDPGIQRLLECSWSQSLDTYRNRMRLIAEHDVRPDLSRLTMPVTIIASCKDKLVPSIREARFMARHIPRARIVELPGLGHMPLVTPSFSLASILCSPEFSTGV